MDHFRKVCPYAHFILFITLPYAVVQMLFVPERDHWVITSYHEGEVRLYDSKFNHVLSDSLKEQIAIIYKEATQSNVLTVRAMPVQQQTGGVDCGCHCFCLPCCIGGKFRGDDIWAKKSSSKFGALFWAELPATIFFTPCFFTPCFFTPWIYCSKEGKKRTFQNTFDMHM